MTEQNKKPESKYDKAAQLLQVMANFAVAIGIFFAAAQLQQTKQMERIRLAVDGTSPIRTPEFLASYGRLIDAYATDTNMFHTDSLRDDLSLVVSVYDNIAILYLRDLADRELIEARVHADISSLIPILDAKKWPIEGRSNLDATLKLMATLNPKPQNANTQEERQAK